MHGTTLTVLGLMADLHAEPIPYGLDALTRVMTRLSPDLLCLEITREDWEAGALGESSLPVRAALAPVAERSDIVIVPVAASPREHHDFAPRSGLRGVLAHRLHRLHHFVQRRSSVRTINGKAYNAFCHGICSLEESLWSRSARRAWEAENQTMLEDIMAAVARDPGRRVLVAVQCQRKHWLDERLEAAPGVDLVDYWDFPTPERVVAQ